MPKQRVQRDPAKGDLVLQRRLLDKDPLVDIEPGAVWQFEPDADPSDVGRPGKLLRLLTQVAPRNFVPGDWVYIRNTDEATQGKTGYEGSNAVYQWRHRVFSRSRDDQRLQRLTQADFERLGRSPDHGDLVLGYRAVPDFFGFEPLPFPGS